MHAVSPLFFCLVIFFCYSDAQASHIQTPLTSVSYITSIDHECEDTHVVHISDEALLVGVFDGHGGTSAAQWLSKRWQHLFAAKCKVHLGSTGQEACAHCHSVSLAPHVMPRCSRCSVTPYCSPQCQSKHWATHQTHCDGQQSEILTGVLFFVRSCANRVHFRFVRRKASSHINCHRTNVRRSRSALSEKENVVWRVCGFRSVARTNTVRGSPG
jgi:hypothetical protein